MNVLFLQGSPRRDGNTEIVCGRMAEAMRRQGAQAESVRLADLRIGGCIECFKCQQALDEPGCSIEDDMTDLYSRILVADALVLATPVFCWGPTSQLKAALDRFYAFCKFGRVQDGRFRVLVEGKPTALVVTAGGGPYDGAELCVASYRAMASFLRLDDRGEFVAAPAGEPAKVRGDAALLARAEQFATQMMA